MVKNPWPPYFQLFFKLIAEMLDPRVFFILLSLQCYPQSLVQATFEQYEMDHRIHKETVKIACTEDKFWLMLDTLTVELDMKNIYLRENISCLGKACKNELCISFYVFIEGFAFIDFFYEKKFIKRIKYYSHEKIKINRKWEN